MAKAAADSLTGASSALPPAVAAEPSLPGYAWDRLRAAEAFPKARLIRRDFPLARLDLTVWFASRELADLCETRLVRRIGDDAAAARAQVYAMDAEADGWEPPATWRETAGFSTRSFERALAAEGLRGFYHHEAPSWQFFAGAIGTGVQTLPTALGIPPWETGSPLRLFLHWAHAAAGRRLTHAATLGLDGRGALIVGPSGSGKSGTTLAGLLHGLTSVGDDYVLLEEEPSLMAHAVFSVFKQDREGLCRAGLSPDLFKDLLPNWHGKIEFDAARLAPKAFADRMEIGAILIPEIARHPRTRLEPVSAKEAALALAPSAVFQLPGDTVAGFRFFANIARRLPAFRLLLSDDPPEIADAVGSFLAKGRLHSD